MNKDYRMEGIYRAIRELRIQKGLTQQAVADQMCMVVSAYSKIERGETELTIKRLFEIADIFGVHYSHILDRRLGRRQS